MAQLPDSQAVASGFVPAKSADVFELVSDIENWPRIFPQWTASVEADDDRFTATGPAREKFDLYPHRDAERHAIDVECVDELGSADTLLLRVLDIPGGSLVIASHGRFKGTSDAAWQTKRDAVSAGLSALSID